jgi:hypothetical protein
MEYSESLSVSANDSAQFPENSGSAKEDFSTSEHSNLANSFTCISYNVTRHILSIDLDDIRAMMLPGFATKLNATAEHAYKGSMTQAFALFDDYGLIFFDLSLSAAELRSLRPRIAAGTATKHPLRLLRRFRRYTW